MASAAEQLAANLSLGTFSKATELKQRIWFTLAALIVYRLGTYIPIPGVDASVMAEMMQRPGGGITVRRWTASREVLNTRPRWP
jgi:preprotein translocase subunit SecY